MTVATLAVFQPGGRYCARSPRTPLGRSLAYSYAPGVGKMLLRKRTKRIRAILRTIQPKDPTRTATSKYPYTNTHTGGPASCHELELPSCTSSMV